MGTVILIILSVTGWGLAAIMAAGWASAHARAEWCLEGWNRTCALNDKHRDLTERQHDRIHDLTVALAAAKGERV